MPVSNIIIKNIDRPDLAIAGETYTLDFEVLNCGNSKNTIIYGIKSNLSYDIKLSSKEDIFFPEESKTIRVTVKTNNSGKQSQTNIVCFFCSL